MLRVPICNKSFLPVFQEGIEVKMKSGCEGTSGQDNNSCDISEGF